MQPPQGLVEKVKGLGKLKRLADSLPKSVRSGPAQDVVHGARPRQPADPALLAGRPGPFITLPAVITRDPRTGTRNVGMYRMQKIDARTTFMHWQIHKDGAADWRGHGRPARGRRRARARPDDRLLGQRAAAEDDRRVHARRLSARDARSSSSGRRRSTSRCPRTRRSSSRATSRRASSGSKGRSATTRATTRRRSRFPIFHLTCMTMRRDAIYPSIVVGVPPAEDAWLGKATERIFLPAIRMTVPEIVDYDLPVAGAFHNCVIVSIRKAFPGAGAQGHARDLGPRHAQPLEVGGRRRRVRGRPRLRERLLPRLRERRPEAGRQYSPTGLSTSSTMRPSHTATAESWASTQPTSGRARGRGRGPSGS